MAKSLRDRIKEKAKQLTEEASASNKYTYGGGESYYAVPDGTGEWKPSPGKDGKGELHRFDVIPFVVGKVFPDKTFVGRPPEEGDPAFRVDLNVHFGVGPDNAGVVCPKHSFRSGIAKGSKKGCPICELMAEKQSETTDDKKRKEIYNSMRAKRRCIYNIIVRDGGEEEEKGVQIYEVSHAVFQERLNEAQDMLRKEGEGEVQYADPDDGKVVLINAYTKDTGGFTFTDISSVKFKDRLRGKKEYVITDEELEQAHDPATFLKLLSYDEISELISEESVKPVKEEKAEEDPPFESRKKKAEKKEEKVKEEKVKEEEEEDNEDDEKCPHGYELGVDYLEQDVCNDCEGGIYRSCMQAHKSIRRSKKK